MPQRDTYRQSKPFCTAPQSILHTQKYMYVWWRSASFVSSDGDNIFLQSFIRNRVNSPSTATSTHRTDSFGDLGGTDLIVNKPGNV